MALTMLLLPIQKPIQKPIQANIRQWQYYYPQHDQLKPCYCPQVTHIVTGDIITQYDYTDSSVVKKVIKKIWLKHADGITNMVRRESTFNPWAKNPNSSAIGFTQIIRSTAEDIPFSYEQLQHCPWLNLVCGTNYYLDICLPKADGNYELAYLLYKFGPNSGIELDAK